MENHVTHKTSENSIDLYHNQWPSNDMWMTKQVFGNSYGIEKVTFSNTYNLPEDRKMTIYC